MDDYRLGSIFSTARYYGRESKSVVRRIMGLSEIEHAYNRIPDTIKSVINAQYKEINTWIFISTSIGILVSLFATAFVFDNQYPNVRRIETDDSTGFVGERAYQNLILLSSIQPKFVGSYENERIAACLENRIRNIISNSPRTPNKVSMDVQIVSGNYSAVQKEIVYQNIRNIVVKIDSNKHTNEGILLSCHYDSLFASPGASSSTNCAVLLEVLRVLSRIRCSFKKHIIFLFNGAEEDGLSGSHGFITQHEWAKQITSFIHLDAWGAGGRQILFQTGPGAFVLHQMYAKSVPYPNSIVISEELFQTGLLPSETDSRNFRNYAGLKGFDFTYCKNGYVYHTSSDDISGISENVIQLAGDNVLALTKALLDYDNLNENIYRDNQKTVYFDIFGKYVIYYTAKTAFFINLIVAILSICSALYMISFVFEGKSLELIVRHVLIDAICVIIGILAVTPLLYLLAKLMKLNDATMLWYSNWWFAITYYATPVPLVMFTAVKMRQTFLHSVLDCEQETKVFIFVVQMIITFLLLVGTFLGIRSTFILAVGLIGAAISHFVINGICLKYEIAERKFLMYVGINLVPAAYISYVFLPFLRILIPMLGRKGANFDSETILCLVVGIATFIILAYFIPLVLMVKSFGNMHYIFIVIYFMHAILVISGAFLTPFGDSTPQRYVVLHVNRQLEKPGYGREENSGYLVTPMDMRGRENILQLFENRTFEELSLFDQSCNQQGFCSMPSLYSSLIHEQPLSLWTKAEKPLVANEKNISCVSNTFNLTKTFHCELYGSKFMDAAILPLNRAKLIEWSFQSSIPSDQLKWTEGTVYYVRLHQGFTAQNCWSFWLKFDVSNAEQKFVFKLAWSVFHLSSNFTSNFQQFISNFPSWTRVTSMSAEYEIFYF